MRVVYMAPPSVYVRSDFFLKEHNIFSVISGEEHTHSFSPFYLRFGHLALYLNSYPACEPQSTP
jgi:hypothetical protein